MMLPDGSEHGAVAAEVAGIVRDFVKPRGLGAVFGAETGFQIARDPDTVRAPDVAFVRAQRIQNGLPQGFFPGSPDLAVEVLSPNDRPSEVAAKVRDWLDAGCLVIWVVDTTVQTVTVFRKDRATQIVQAAEMLTDDTVLPGFETPVAGIFAV
jgi:Uma2 family endonuclease